MDSVAETEEVEAEVEADSAVVIVADEAASHLEAVTVDEVADEVRLVVVEVRLGVVAVVPEAGEVVPRASEPRVPVPLRWNPTSTLVSLSPRSVERTRTRLECLADSFLRARNTCW